MGEQVSERDELAAYLVDRGMAEARPGYGYATGTEVADAALAWFAEHRGPRVVAEAREQVARELEALLPTDDEVADPQPCSAGHDCHEAARYVTVRRAQRIARGETKGGE